MDLPSVTCGQSPEQLLEENRRLRAQVADQEALRLANQTLQQQLEARTAELQESQAQYRILFENAPDAIFLAHPDGRITAANPAACAMFGMSEQEICQAGRQGLVVHDPEMVAGLAQRDRIGQGHGVATHIRKDGSRFIGEVRTVALGGKEQRSIAIIRDITEHKRVEEALRISEEKFAVVFYASPVAKALVRMPEGLLDDVNDAWLRLTGFSSKQQVVGKTTVELGLRDPEARQKAIDDFRRDGEVRSAEMTIRTSAGEQRTVLVDLVPVEVGGRSLMLSTILDITQRKQAEEALRRSEEKFAVAFAANAAAIALTRLEDGSFLEVNDTWLALTGYSREEAMGRPLASAIWATPEARARFVRELRAKGAIRGWEEELRKKSGERFVAQVSAQMLRMRDEEVVLSTLVDVTARKQAEEALRQFNTQLEQRVAQRTAEVAQEARKVQAERQRFLDMLDTLPVIIDIIRADHRIEWANRAYREALGNNIGRLCYQSQFDINEPCKECEAFRPLQTGQPHHWEWTLPNGRTFDIYNFPFAAADGSPAILEMDIDITEQRQAAAVLREMNVTLEQRVAERTEAMQRAVQRYEQQVRLFEGVASTTPDFVYLFDLQGRFQYANRRLLEVWGMQLANVIGKTCRELGYEQWHHDMHMREIAQVIATKRPIKGEVPFKAPLTGTFGVYEYIFTPVIGPDGEVDLIAGTTRDVTDRKQAEEALRQSNQRLELAMEAIQASQSYWDIRSNTLQWNARAYELLGYAPGSITPSYEAWRSRIHPEDLPRVETGIQESRGEHQSFLGEYRVIWPDGSIHWVRSARRFDYDSDGQPQTCTSIMYDISDLKAAEQQMREAKEAAEAASKAKDQFIAVLSHELRTPLTPAVAALALLRTDMRLPSDVHEDLEMISRNLDLEVRLIADLLDVSRIISGKLHLEKRSVDVAETIREAAKIVAGDLEAKGQTLTIETPGTPYLTWGDAARLQQVFWNLLRNSIKFSPARSTIVVRASVAPAEYCPLDQAGAKCPMEPDKCPLPRDGNGEGPTCGGNLVVEVIDRGSGIAPEMLPRLFNAFEQEEKARAFGGLGLGLSICRAVVEMHGGTIAAHSQGIGCGATFTVRLPVVQCPAAPVRSSEEVSRDPRQEVKPTWHRDRGLRILLVEDNADTAKLLRRLLIAQGHVVTTAGSVGSALAAMQMQRPDVLISDLGLPDGSGLDLMRQLVAQGRQVPAIALSGYGTPADIERSRAAGFAEHLVKPLSSVEALTEALAQLTAPRRRSER